MRRALKRGGPLTSRATISVDTVTVLDYPPESEMMFADQSETRILNDLSLDTPVDPHTRGGDDVAPVACSVVSNEPVLILSSLSQYAEYPETSLESPIEDTDFLPPFSLALVTTTQLSCTKHRVQLRTPDASCHIDAHSIPSPKRGTPQYGYVPDECDIWIHFYIFRDIIIGVMILPAYGFGILMWCHIRPASESRTHTQPSPAMDLGVRGHNDASNSHPKLAATVARLLENKPTWQLTGYEREAAIVFTADQEHTVAANAPHTFYTNARLSVDRLRSTWKAWSDSTTNTRTRTAQWLSISAQILSVLILWSLWTS
jgi:hypothetical protein